MTASSNVFGSERRYQLFTAVKYLTFLLLGINVYLFLQEELLTLAAMGADSVAAGQLVQVFSATIDTAAWIILLLLFELETSVLDDRRIHGPVQWALHGIRGLCSIAIVYAFTGYYAELTPLYDVAPFLGNACAMADQSWSVLVNLDEFVPLDAVSCAALGGEVYQLQGFNVLTSADSLAAAKRLAWVDVINAGVWILVVVVLEIEVRLQLRGKLSASILGANKYFKSVLYGVLFFAAAYWGVAGDFLDFWDASLWLFAFIFIEMNVFEWQYESRPDTAAV
ncbi:hypothetical protein Q6D67_04885 [Haliea sp. E1-2-M8]|uniref:hypothetical protein n=1 Tax=Haliea sp. E1-2-M8 TaxID=3064706 RepID=UPI002722D6CD|nr:hypothetical protein [Haliea sp. E1-2-M8]MDO8861031.1 hypothetical protein [Haliea sp. E1-2-M8]